ncbi:MAG TPA: hypothetical protein VM658_17205 [bacterium]|nr:hypothetical protein [bacterium]
MKKLISKFMGLTWRDILWGMIFYAMTLAVLFFVFAKSVPTFIYVAF